MTLIGTSSRAWLCCRAAGPLSTGSRPSWLYPTAPGATTELGLNSSPATGRRTSRAQPSSTPRGPAPSTPQSWATTATGQPNCSSPVWRWRPPAGFLPAWFLLCSSLRPAALTCCVLLLDCVSPTEPLSIGVAISAALYGPECRNTSCCDFSWSRRENNMGKFYVYYPCQQMSSPLHDCTSLHSLSACFFFLSEFRIECFRRIWVSGPSHNASKWWIMMILTVNNASLNGKTMFVL